MKRKNGFVLPLAAIAVAACALFSRGETAGAPAAQTAAAPVAQTVWASREILLTNWRNPLPDDYRPGELVNLYEQGRSFQLAASDILLERETYEAAERMFARAAEEGVTGFIISSGYRTREKQQSLYDADQNGTTAAPGTSEHQTGLAFDVTARRDAGGFEDTPQYAWLIENCWEYGFILRYPAGKQSVTGIPFEPWHYRYVGAEAALAMRAGGWTLEEYLSAR